MMNWNALYDRLRAEAPALELRRDGSCTRRPPRCRGCRGRTPAPPARTPGRRTPAAPGTRRCPPGWCGAPATPPQAEAPKECSAGGGEEDPCAIFRQVQFPTEEFFPPNTDGVHGVHHRDGQVGAHQVLLVQIVHPAVGGEHLRAALAAEQDGPLVEYGQDGKNYCC